MVHQGLQYSSTGGPKFLINFYQQSLDELPQTT